MRSNCPSGLVNQMLVNDDLFVLLSQGLNGSLLRHVGEHLQDIHNLSNKFNVSDTQTSEKLFGVLGAKM